MPSELDRYLAQGEGISLEFKRCGNQPEHDVFETVCSFANRQGGSILLGVTDGGEVEGVEPATVASMERNIVNVVNDPNCFSPSPAVEFEQLKDEDGRIVVRVWVPMGPSTYRFKGVVYDRAADVDICLRGDAQINALALRKQSYYTERRVYPWVSESDLQLDMLPRLRGMMAAAHANHPWVSLADDDLLRASRLYARDPETGTRGFTLAAIVLLGKEDTILDVAPIYRTDAVVRRRDEDRYDDRLTVTTNLIEAYDQLVGFCARWLPDPFVLEGAQRVSPRDVIIRELVANTLMHREFSSPHISTLAIGRDSIKTRNPSRSLFSGPVTPQNLDPTPKNPTIARFFTQLGLAEELGSGTRNLYRASQLYTGTDPTLVDGDFFDARVPVPSLFDAPVAEKDAGRQDVRSMALSLLQRPEGLSASELAARASVNMRTAQRCLAALVAEGSVERVGAGRSTAYRAVR